MAQIVQWNTTPSGSAGNHFTARSVYVDNVYGNDTTGQLNNQHLPYRTLQAAIDALGNAGTIHAVVHILSVAGGGSTYNYTGTYTFNRIKIITYNFVTVNITNIPTTELYIELSGKSGNMVLTVNNQYLARLDVISKNTSNNLTLNYSPVMAATIRRITISGSYLTLNTFITLPMYVDYFYVLFTRCYANTFNFTRTGEKTIQDFITIENSKFNNVNITTNNIANNTPNIENNLVFRILNSTFNELTGSTSIFLDKFAEGLSELYIENSQIYALNNIEVVGIIRCYHSRIEGGIVYAHIPDDHISNPYIDGFIGEIYASHFNHCIFGATRSTPVFVMDVPVYSFEYCSFRSTRGYDPGDPDDRFRFIIWDTCPSTMYDRNIRMKHIKLYIPYVESSDPVSAFLFVRGTENIYGFSQRYYIEHCNCDAPETLDYFVLFDEKYFYGSYPFLSSLLFNPIPVLGSKGSYDITYKYNEVSRVNQNITLYSLVTPNRTYIRDYYNRYDSLRHVHSGTSTTDAYVYHTEANNSYDLAGRLYGDSKQVIRFWNSGALGINAEDKTHVLEPGFTGPVFITSASNFLDYKEFTIINNSGIPITINPTPGETIDGFTSIVLGVNQRITLKRVGLTSFASV